MYQGVAGQGDKESQHILYVANGFEPMLEMVAALKINGAVGDHYEKNPKNRRKKQKNKKIHY